MALTPLAADLAAGAGGVRADPPPWSLASCACDPLTTIADLTGLHPEDGLDSACSSTLAAALRLRAADRGVPHARGATPPAPADAGITVRALDRRATDSLPVEVAPLVAVRPMAPQPVVVLRPLSQLPRLGDGRLRPGLNQPHRLQSDDAGTGEPQRPRSSGMAAFQSWLKYTSK